MVVLTFLILIYYWVDYITKRIGECKEFIIKYNREEIVKETESAWKNMIELILVKEDIKYNIYDIYNNIENEDINNMKRDYYRLGFFGQEYVKRELKKMKKENK